MKRIAIYDMDGTIVDSSHRYRTITENGITKIDLQFWRDNERLAFNDSLLPLAHSHYAADLADPDCFVIIATARVMDAVSWQFVEEKLGKPDYIISRKAGDTRSGALLKVLGLKKLFSLKQFHGKVKTAVFYEDNTSYLKAVCDHFGIRGVYVPSVQGH